MKQLHILDNDWHKVSLEFYLSFLKNINFLCEQGVVSCFLLLWMSFCLFVHTRLLLRLPMPSPSTAFCLCALVKQIRRRRKKLRCRRKPLELSRVNEELIFKQKSAHTRLLRAISYKQKYLKNYWNSSKNLIFLLFQYIFQIVLTLTILSVFKNLCLHWKINHLLFLVFWKTGHIILFYSELIFICRG